MKGTRPYRALPSDLVEWKDTSISYLSRSDFFVLVTGFIEWKTRWFVLGFGTRVRCEDEGDTLHQDGR